MNEPVTPNKYPDPGGPTTVSPGAVAARLAVRAFFGLVSVGAALILAVTAFNFVVMPFVVRQGKEVDVPAVAGLPLDEAVAVLNEVGLAVREPVERVSPTVEAGTVLDQDPPAGRAVKPERQVLLVVSKGGRERMVPDVPGQTLRFARILLGQEGYSVGDVVRIPSDRLGENFVLASDPPESTRMASGSNVSLLVSAGSEPAADGWILPDLSGRRVGSVAADLRAAGFQVEVADDPLDRLGGMTQITGTVPEAGARVRRGDRIVLLSS